MSESTSELEVVQAPVESVEPETPPVPQTVGGALRAAREAKGMSADEAARMLKLGLRQLQALESDHWTALPGATFTRGFVRNYARLLQIDPAPLMAGLEGALDERKPDLALPQNLRASMPEFSGKAQKKDYAVVSVGAAALVVAVLIYFFLPNDLNKLIEATQSLFATVSRSPATAAPASSSAAPAQGEPVLPPGSSLGQVINPQSVQAAAGSAPLPVAAKTSANGEAPPLRLVFDKESWVEVRDRNGRVLFQQSGTAGTERDIDGEGPFALTIGYAPGVRVLQRGQPVDLTPHLRGDVARLSLE